MYILIVILVVLASLLMIGIVLIQESKGGGLASSFSSSNQIMGVRKTTDMIEKATWSLAAFMVVASVISAYVIPSATATESVVSTEATQQSSTNPNNMPGFGASQKEAAPAQGADKAAAPAAETPAAPAN